MRQKIWLSYDLGVRGDYEAFYTWLDQLKARECGTNLAVFDYEWNGSLKEALEAEIGAAIQISRNTRIYAIYNHEGRIRGSFIIGRRKAPPWSGYAPQTEPADMDVSEYAGGAA